MEFVEQLVVGEPELRQLPPFRAAGADFIESVRLLEREGRVAAARFEFRIQSGDGGLVPRILLRIEPVEFRRELRRNQEPLLLPLIELFPEQVPRRCITADQHDSTSVFFMISEPGPKLSSKSALPFAFFRIAGTI